jgi:hypothetical protein
MLEFLTKHFLVLSSLLVGVASAISMIFLTAYLAVFDWSLVWLIEYSDLAKLALIGIAVISSILGFITNNLLVSYQWFALRQKGFRFVFWLAVVLTVVGQASNIYFDVRHKTGQGEYPFVHLHKLAKAAYLSRSPLSSGPKPLGIFARIPSGIARRAAAGHAA